MKNYFYIILLVLASVACNNKKNIAEPERVYSTKLDGKYFLLEIHATQPVDINFDGQYSTDMRQEVEEFNQTEKYLLEFSTYPSNFIPTQNIDQWMPNSTVITNSSNGEFIRVDYGLRNLLAGYFFDEPTQRIDVINSYNIREARLIAEDTIEIKSELSFYTSNGWENLYLTATYKK